MHNSFFFFFSKYEVVKSFGILGIRGKKRPSPTLGLTSTWRLTRLLPGAAPGKPTLRSPSGAARPDSCAGSRKRIRGYAMRSVTRRVEGILPSHLSLRHF